MKPDVKQVIQNYYPKAVNCRNGHIGPTISTWYEESDDGCIRLMIVERCEYCGMPNGADEYVTYEQQQAFERGEECPQL